MTQKDFTLLIMNTGSTSTKVAFYRNEKPLFTSIARHENEELKNFKSFWEQYDLRRKIVQDLLKKYGFSLQDIDAVVSRGGTWRPIQSGVFLISQAMLSDAQSGVYGSHPCSVGCKVAFDLGKEIGKPSLTVDPPCVDEMISSARYAGLPIFHRASLFQALNQKAIARRLASQLGLAYEKMSAIIVHMGGGMSIAAHENGKVIDVNNGLDGDGPMAPERAGTSPAGQLIKLCFSGKHSEREVHRMINGQGGLVAHLGTTDAIEIVRRIESGDDKAMEVFDAMIYQIAKSIGAAAASLKGKTQAIALTGGLAHSQYLVNSLARWVGWIANIHTFPGENEMEALAAGALRYLRGEEEAQPY